MSSFIPFREKLVIFKIFKKVRWKKFHKKKKLLDLTFSRRGRGDEWRPRRGNVRKDIRIEQSQQTVTGYSIAGTSF